MHRTSLIAASLFGALGVALGAMGAHLLKDKLAPESLVTFETAVRYQMYHVLALLGVYLLGGRLSDKMLAWSSRLFVAGILLFSGSLYFLCLRPLMGMEGQMGWMGAVTPFGGLAFISGWLLLLAAALKKN